VKSVLRILAILAMVTVFFATTVPAPVAALSPSEMSVTGGSACSFAEGAGFILGIAGFFHPAAAIAAFGIGAGVLFFC
jgi:hypothetical protein